MSVHILSFSEAFGKGNLRRNKYMKMSKLLALALVLLISVGTLAGSTIAWFTDTVTSTGNTIKAGTLQLEVAVKSDESSGFVTLSDDKPDTVFDYELWEPGYAATRGVQIKNAGTLALKYELNIIPNGEGELSALANVIDVYSNAAWPTSRTDLGERLGSLADIVNGTVKINGNLAAGAADDVRYLTLKMQEEAGNEYQGLSIGTTFDLQVLATQDTVEYDSFDNQYDADAVVPVEVTDIQGLKAAIANAENGDIIMLQSNITDADGVVITDKNITIDLNGKTFTISEGASTNNRNFKIDGSSVVTIQNGTLIADGDITSGAYGTVRTEGTANVTLSNLKLYSYRGYGLNVKACTGTSITINDTEIYAQYGGGVEAAGGTIELNDVTIEQEGVYSGAAWCSVAIGVNGGGKVTVNSGTYSAAPIATDGNAAQGTWVAYVMSSGGDLVINGGTFNGTVANTTSAANACGVICADRAAVVEINGGTFNSNGAILDMRNNVGTLPNPVATLNGGVFSADPTVSGLGNSNLIKVGEGSKVIDNKNGTWTVAPNFKEVDSVAELRDALAEGGVVRVDSNIDFSASEENTIVVPEGKTVTLDLQGHTLTSDNKTVAIEAVGNLTISNGTLTNEPNDANSAFPSIPPVPVSVKGGMLTLEDVTVNVQGSYYETGVTVNTGTLNLNEGTVIKVQGTGGETYGVWALSSSTINFNGGKIVVDAASDAASIGIFNYAPITINANSGSILVNAGTDHYGFFTYSPVTVIKGDSFSIDIADGASLKAGYADVTIS